MDACVNTYSYGDASNLYNTTQPPYTTTVRDKIQTLEEENRSSLKSKKFSKGCNIAEIVVYSALTVVAVAGAVFTGYVAWNFFLLGNVHATILFGTISFSSLAFASIFIAKIVFLAKEIHEHKLAQKNFMTVA
ncbi:hypothetical protein BN1013_01511 [Candidatus Rubidus massiliensis]|nr:hypothetical protein BN1013_01511 [Candidatus Rubidus massiliensis]